MLAKLNTYALVGIDALPVEAEVDVSAGLPKTVLVGLPEASVRESTQLLIDLATPDGAASGLLYDSAVRRISTPTRSTSRCDGSNWVAGVASGRCVR